MSSFYYFSIIMKGCIFVSSRCRRSLKDIIIFMLLYSYFSSVVIPVNIMYILWYQLLKNICCWNHMLTFIAIKKYNVQKEKGVLLFHMLLHSLYYKNKGILPPTLLIHQVINVTVNSSIFLTLSSCTTAT